MRIIYVAIICCCLALAACGKKSPEQGSRQPGNPAKTPSPMRQVYAGRTPQDAVKNIILRYNELIPFGYEHLNMNPLQEVATQRQAEKAYFHMAAIGEAHVRMISQVKQVEFTSLTFKSPTRAEVSTREVWDFAYHDIKTGKKNEEFKDFVYLMKYTLENKNGRWLISGTSAVGEEKPGR